MCDVWKGLMIKELRPYTQILGRHCYQFQCVADSTQHALVRVLTGAVLSGSILLLRSCDTLQLPVLIPFGQVLHDLYQAIAKTFENRMHPLVCDVCRCNRSMHVCDVCRCNRSMHVCDVCRCNRSMHVCDVCRCNRSMHVCDIMTRASSLTQALVLYRVPMPGSPFLYPLPPFKWPSLIRLPHVSIGTKCHLKRELKIEI